MNNDLRKYMNLFRGDTPKPYQMNEKNINEGDNIRKMLNNMRSFIKLNEESKSNKVTLYDQKREEEKFLNNFSDDEVRTDFQDLEVYDDDVFWGGTTHTQNGSLDWIYVVSKNPDKNGFIPNDDSNFDVTIPENKTVMNKLKIYYDEFYKYWRDGELID